MIVKWWEPRIKIWTLTDSRLQNEQGRYCLCTLCSKTSLETDEDQSHVCERHDKFIKETRALGISAPVFACPEFMEKPDHEDLLLIGLQRELLRSTQEELAWASNKLLDYMRSRKINDNFKS